MNYTITYAVKRELDVKVGNKLLHMHIETYCKISLLKLFRCVLAMRKKFGK